MKRYIKANNVGNSMSIGELIELGYLQLYKNFVYIGKTSSDLKTVSLKDIRTNSFEGMDFNANTPVRKLGIKQDNYVLYI